MELFRESLSDGEWVKEVKPFYVASRPFVRVVRDAVTEVNTLHHNVASLRAPQTQLGRQQQGHAPMAKREMWIGEERDHLLGVACTNLTSLTKTISDLPSPSSAEARRAKKDLGQALRLYLRCAIRVNKLLGRFGGRFGENYARGRMFEISWTGMEAASLEQAIESAGRKMDTAARFIDTNRPIVTA